MDPDFVSDQDADERLTYEEFEYCLEVLEERFQEIERTQGLAHHEKPSEEAWLNHPGTAQPIFQGRYFLGMIYSVVERLVR